MRKPHCTEQALLKRRDVIKGGAVVLASAFFPFSIEILNAGSAVAAPPAPSGTGEERILWNSCNVNCGSRCALRVHVKDGVITRVETDNTGDDRYGMQQLRACPRGRSMRQRIYAEQRIPYPLRRVGNRGEGKFERISWEEAFKEIGQRLRGTIDTYGNEAVYLNYGTGALGSTMGKSWPPAATPVARLMNLVGGYLNHYSDYSTCQITVGMPYLYGGSWVDGNSLSDMENSELAVFFGNNPSETRMSGCKAKTLQHARFTRNTRVIIIDPRYTDSMVSVGDEWIPIRPGTDAALSAALAYVMITEDLIDKPFLAKYTIGYDEESLPKGAPAGSSYKSYILGQGPDKTPKTPAWASRITGIPPARIEKLAREIAGARPCFICQGWGPQRTTNGENISRAIGMLAVLTGNVGIKGSQAGTTLKAMLNKMAAPTKEAQELFQKLGVTVKDSAGNLRSPVAVLGEMAEGLKTMGTAEQIAAMKMIVGEEAIAGFSELIKQEGIGAIAEYARQLEAGGGNGRADERHAGRFSARHGVGLGKPANHHR